MEKEIGKALQGWLKPGPQLKLLVMPKNIICIWPQTKKIKEEVYTT